MTRKPPLILPLLALLLLAGCAGAPRQRDAAVAARAHELTVSVEDEQRYRAQLQQNPTGLPAAEARYFLGQAAFNRGQYPAADELFRETVKRHPGTGWDSNAYFMHAFCLERLGQLGPALDAYEALAKLDKGWQDLPEQARKAGERLVRERLDRAGLESQAATRVQGPFAPLLHFRLAEERLRAGELQRFLDAVEEHRVRYPASPWQMELERMTGEAYRKVPIRPRALGLMVPTGGEAARFGLEVQQGVQLALDQANTRLAEAERFTLARVDEGSTTAQAVAAARRLVEDDKVIGILGPLFSEAADAAATVAARYRSPLLSPSAARPGLAKDNPFFFRNCITNEKQARQMADHALLALRLQRLGVLYPDTAYGRGCAEAFRFRVEELAGTVAAYVSYTAGTQDFKQAMLDLGGVDPGIYKEAESEGRKELQAGVERACSGLGETIVKVLQAAAGPAPEAKPTPLPKGVPTTAPTPVLRLAVVDLACDSPAAALNSGRALSDRFRRTLALLEEQGLQVLPPGQAFDWMARNRLAPEDLNPSGAAALARALNAQLVLAGTVAEQVPDLALLAARAAKGGAAGAKAQRELERAQRWQTFTVTAQLIDAASTSVLAVRGFDFTKLRPLSSNAQALQALYIPAQKAVEVMQIAPNLVFHELRLPLLGSNSWHRGELLREAEALEGARFTTAFFAGSPQPEVQAFVKAYQEKYAAAPTDLAAQAYDAARMVLEACLKGATTREDLRAALQDLGAYPGVSGETSFTASRDAVKKLPLLEIKGGEFLQVP
jgi:ABC-type branched-subunit amino acid transport system substrate-binding protein